MTHPPIKSLFLLYLIPLVAFGTPLNSYAKLLRIIHTNDIHALFETSEHGVGGLAQIKAVIEDVRAKSTAEGVETILLDGGDFSDGTIYRYAYDGAGPLMILDSMGYDAVGLGNHDWIISADGLNQIYSAADPTTPVLAANFQFDPLQQTALAKHIKPFISLEKAGVKIAILGLTTNQFVYRWLIDEGTVNRIDKRTGDLIRQLKKTHDYVFVLSHMGFSRDRNLVRRYSGVDLIVGSHSHDMLYEPFFQRAYTDGQTVPIVQVGAHGEHVGSMLLDVTAGKNLKVVDYQAIPVKTDGPKDSKITSMIATLRESLEAQYGAGWLDTVVAHSEVPMDPPTKGPTFWGSYYAQVMMETANTDAALDMSPFYGATQPAGPITRKTLFDFYPRTYDVSQPYGWTVWRSKIPGWLLKTIITVTVEVGGYANTAGITYKVKKVGPLKAVYDFKIKGKKLNLLDTYEVAITEGIGRGANEISKMLRKYFKPEDTGVPLWQAVERKITGKVIRAPASDVKPPL